MTKTCTRCGTEYPATTEFFYKRKDGLYPHCKPCQNILTAQWRKEHPDKRKAIKKRCDQKHRCERNAYTRKWLKEHPEEAKRRRINIIKMISKVATTPEKMEQNNKERKISPKAFSLTKDLWKCSSVLNHSSLCEILVQE